MATQAPTQAVAVVVPVYRDRLTADERVSIRHLNRYLGSYDRYLAMPERLSFSMEGYAEKRFPDWFFTSKHNYSRLLLTRDFYRAFSRYDYILIYQLDCLVLSDELRFWCGRDFDYIGAVHTIADLPACVGNGGFSLRRVASFLAVLNSKTRAVDPRAYWTTTWGEKPALGRLRAAPRRAALHLRSFNNVSWEIRRLDRTPHGWPEDWFWSLEAKRFWPPFRVADNEDGDRFAFDSTPRETFARIGKLPFGCHAWNRFERDFWEPHLLS